MWQMNAYDERHAVSASAQIPCVLMPGWSCNGDIFEWLLPALAQHFIVDVASVSAIVKDTTLTDFSDHLAQKIFYRHSRPVVLFAWSLAGNVALEIAKQYPDKILAVCLISTSPCFVAREDWLLGMPIKTFEFFQTGIITHSQKTLNRFDVLQAKGDAAQKFLLESLKDYRSQQRAKGEAWSDESLKQGLSFLANVDQRQLLQDLSSLQKIPLLWCLGENDQLVNASVANDIQKLHAYSDVLVIKGAGHLPFLTQTDSVFNAFIPLVEKAVQQHEKNKIAQSFSNAAKYYDEASALQQYVAQKLINKLPRRQTVLLDVGCGTGYWFDDLQAKSEMLIGLDIAEGMLRYAQQQSSRACCLGGDMENLPLPNDSIDTIFSSLAVQWCQNLTPLLNEWQRVLKKGGKVYLATLGVNTLTELRQSFQQVDDDRHVNQFLSKQEIVRQIDDSALSCETIEHEVKVMPYDSMKELMRDLKAIGAHHVLGKSVKGLMGKKRFSQAEQSYEKFRGRGVDSQKLPASYDVFYLTLGKE